MASSTSKSWYIGGDDVDHFKRPFLGKPVVSKERNGLVSKHTLHSGNLTQLIIAIENGPFTVVIAIKNGSNS